uniref:Uncharacterized protein n=1 Tax=Panagrolaimus sp. ES5 TaxID=591445 RepID=A0AC34FX64_9BILA
MIIKSAESKEATLLHMKNIIKLSSINSKVEDTCETTKSRSFNLLIWLRIKKLKDLSSPNNEDGSNCESGLSDTFEIIKCQKYVRNFDPF